MKKKITLLLLCAAGLLSTASARSQNPQLNGKWTLESVSVVQANDGSTTNLTVAEAKENIAFGLYDELVFSGEQLTLVSGETSAEGPVTITPDLIQTDAAPMPLFFTWKVEDGKLHLEHEHADPSPDKANTGYKILSVYIKQLTNI
jgi:hypothetical protein